MKKLILVLIFLSLIKSFSQTIRLGGTANFLTGNEFLDYQIGPSLIAEYSFNNLQASIQGVFRGYLSELSPENNFIGNYSYNVVSAGITVNYYPVQWAIEPYIGLGFFYNSNNIKRNGNLSPSYGFENHFPSKIRNNFSSEITGGIKFSAQTPINFIVEVTQTFNKPEYELVIIDKDDSRKVEKSKFNFNSLFVKLGLLFEI